MAEEINVNDLIVQAKHVDTGMYVQGFLHIWPDGTATIYPANEWVGYPVDPSTVIK